MSNIARHDIAAEKDSLTVLVVGCVLHVRASTCSPLLCFMRNRDALIRDVHDP